MSEFDPTQSTPTDRKRAIYEERRREFQVRLPQNYCPKCTAVTYPEDKECLDCSRRQPSQGWPPLSERLDPWIGRVLDKRYLLTKRIGRGATGSVYRVESLSISRQFALKILDRRQDPSMPGSMQVLVRLKREIEAMGRLRSPHVVHFYEVLELANEHIGVVMDLVHGETLEQLVEVQGPLSVQRARSLLRQVCNGIYEAHMAGLIHRDIKPENVMVERLPIGDEFIHVLDFGIVWVDGDVHHTHGFIGTPLYASPEQILGKDVDHRSDIYSIGAVLFYLLTGNPPFDGDNVMRVLRSHVYDAPPALSDVLPNHTFNEALQELVARMLAKKPNDRPQHLAEVIRALDALALGPSSETSPGATPAGVSGALPPQAEPSAQRGSASSPLQDSHLGAATPIPPSFAENAAPAPSAETPAQKPSRNGRDRLDGDRALAGVDASSPEKDSAQAEGSSGKTPSAPQAAVFRLSPSTRKRAKGSNADDAKSPHASLPEAPNTRDVSRQASSSSSMDAIPAAFQESNSEVDSEANTPADSQHQPPLPSPNRLTSGPGSSSNTSHWARPHAPTALEASSQETSLDDGISSDVYDVSPQAKPVRPDTLRRELSHTIQLEVALDQTPTLVWGTSDLQVALVSKNTLCVARAMPRTQLSIDVGSSAAITALALGRDYVLLGRENGAIERIDLERGGSQRIYEDVHQSPVTALAMPDIGEMWLAAYKTGRTYLRASGKPATYWARIHEGAVAECLAIQSSGETFAAAREGGRVEIYQTNTPKFPNRSLLIGVPVRSMAFSRDGYLLAVLTEDNDVFIFQSLTGKIVMERKAMRPKPLSLCFSKDNHLVAFCIRDHRLVVIDLQAHLTSVDDSGRFVSLDLESSTPVE